jgi:putative ABC transport system permease protein
MTIAHRDFRLSRPTTAPALPLALRLAWREMRAGLSGFHIFIACVALGVMVISGVGALSEALRSGFERQGATILGGDMAFVRAHQRASDIERSWLQAQGRVSETATMRAMARPLTGEDQSLIELKGVDQAYPLIGSVKLFGDVALDQALAGGAIVHPMLMERLALKVGDRIRIGTSDIPISAVLESEPDGLADRVSYGPRVLLSLKNLVKTGLVQPGSLIRWRYALRLDRPEGTGPQAFADVRQSLAEALPQSGFSVSDRRDPAPQVTRTLERLRQFLTLLGLAALVTGGVGIANAVATFVDRRRKVIATMKSLGASGRTVFQVFVTQVMVMALIGVAVGLALGFVLPPVLAGLFAGQLPIAPEFGISWAGVLLGLAYGVLVALLFALWPLGHAEQVSAAVLFRDEVAPNATWPRASILVLIISVGIALCALAVWSSDSTRVALSFIGALIGVFVFFAALGEGITRLARRIRRPRRPELALAIANLGAPGGLTRSVVLSLGSGLSLLVAVALTDASLVAELKGRLPEESPSYFVLDIAKPDEERFKAAILADQPQARIETAPMLRGRLVSLRGEPVEKIKAPPEADWVLTGDRGLTYSDQIPAGSRVVEGAWWQPGYAGPPLVSFEAELARDLGLRLGDEVTVNVLGRNLTAQIANLREVKWESLSLNFVMVFSANALAGAPHNVLATISLPAAATPSEEVALARMMGRAFPTATAIRVKEAIEAFNSVFSKVMVAVRVAGAVTLIAGALVLAGAMATAQRRRILEAVILRTLGATRARILAEHATEYLLLAAVTAAAAIMVGSAAAYLAVTLLMDLDFTFSWSAVAAALLVATGLVLTFGAVGTWRVLSARPVPHLRSQ